MVLAPEVQVTMIMNGDMPATAARDGEEAEEKLQCISIATSNPCARLVKKKC